MVFLKLPIAGEIITGFASEMGSVAVGFLESSNVDLSEFTEMITSQRAYQSNARV